MRPAARLLASTASGNLTVTAAQASAQLLPPIPLYRRLLRAHRYLPPDMRFMGDAYVKSEFRLTRSTDNPIHIIGFLGQWKVYLDELESARSLADPDQAGEVKAGELGGASESERGNGSGSGNGKPWLGRKLDVESFERMSNEQVGQLYELMHATKELWKSPEENEETALDAEAQAGKGETSGESK